MTEIKSQFPKERPIATDNTDDWWDPAPAVW